MSKSQKKKVVTSLRVDSNLWKNAKIESIKEGITLAAFVEKAIINELKEKNHQRK